MKTIEFWSKPWTLFRVTLQSESREGFTSSGETTE